MNTRRRSSINVPLFSLASTSSWGIGEFLDLPVFARWLKDAGQAAIQILPITEMPPGERSPYSAMTSMALDPIYISMYPQEDFGGIGGDLAMDEHEAAALAACRAAPRIDYAGVRDVKERWLRRGFERFLRLEIARRTPRARRFEQFQDAESWWLDEYAVFRALHARAGEAPWWSWPPGLAARDERALADACEVLHLEITFRKYLQWVAAEQWAEARRRCWPVQVLGDLPFMTAKDSPDVWARQDQFRFDATVGAPPDEYSETGQDWGLPPWRWERFVETDFEWMRARARRNATLFDGLRLDHLVGLYRTYVRPLDAGVPPHFEPPSEPAQLRLGEAIVRIFLESGLEVVAEDLGTVPHFVRASIARLGIPGFKVIRWERAWKEDRQPFIDPRVYPEVSVAMTGLHDLETLAVWWEGLSSDDRAAVLAIPSVAEHVGGRAPTGEVVRDALIRAVLGSRSALVSFPVQDLFGWRDRINIPATVSDDNWGWRVPWPVDQWEREPAAVACAAAMKAATRAAGRLVCEGI
ncbi:MAG: 4-alpha-glucanotransferase [Acidobacteriota bacterium]